MSTTASKKPLGGGVERVSTSETAPRCSPDSPPPAGDAQRALTPTGHSRTRSIRSGTPVSARAAARRDSMLSTAESEARAEATAAAEDLQSRLEMEEKASEKYKKQVDVLQAKLDDAVKESAKLEEKAHEFEEQLEALRNEKRDATRQIREMETIYEAERSAILKEKEDLANREETMQTVIQRLKDNLAQRSHNEDDGRSSRQLANSSPSIDGNSFAPPSSIQRSDSRSSSKLILQKDKLIESLRLELAEAQIKLVESENQGGGRLQEVERLLMEARMANARLMEDNESYQLLLQEKTLKGDFGQSDFSYMGPVANQDALNALEGKANGSSLADELSDAAEADGDGDRRLESELKALKEQNQALTLYINKIIGRLLQHQDFEHILDTSEDLKMPGADASKAAAAAAGDKDASYGQSLLQRAKSIAVGGQARAKARPASAMPMVSAPSSAHTDPETAPSIPIGNLANPSRAVNSRRVRPQSEQFTGAATLVGHMYRGPDGAVSPTTKHVRNSHSFFAGRAASASSTQVPSAGNFPGMRSETSSLSGESGDISTPPSQSPPRSHSDRGTTFAGGKPRQLRLLQENQDMVKDNKRSSWYSGWSWAGKKDEATAPPPAEQSIPE
ncbi:M protein, serotype 2.1 precursor [Drechmeria coniospora]|uniref:M protein, serotype 2.1 n=1 Tax=Drechmeria coniospora TaxID=98403 RepID=A0A151GTM6_DRECN|nr:M protein, serotype 2.1 precursor [Drechmeria coniospora]KYK60476.1 M protein, serotype 2.1 precursor [Drechmeria coniospora]